MREGLKTIPVQSTYYQCINDVINWHKRYPNDWKQTWFEVQKKWSSDIGCPEGIHKPFNIDATVNSAYVIIGLLYGKGDFGKTLDIAARCGQDADCNPSSAGGILGTILGYDNIPAYWKQGLAEAESLKFKYTDLSLNDVYVIGTKHALENVKRQGGQVDGDRVTIRVQQARPVRFEQSFEGHYPANRTAVNQLLTNEHAFSFDGIGFVVTGETVGYEARNVRSAYIFKLEVYLDEKRLDVVELPTDFITRRHELCWQYKLPKGNHRVRLKLLNPTPQHRCQLGQLIVYTDKPSRSDLK